MEEYQDTFDDYLELYIQFGYVFLFSSVYPVAAFWALLNNLVELRADAFKMCKLFRRPFMRKVKDIGAWQVVLPLKQNSNLNFSVLLRSWEHCPFSPIAASYI